MMNPNNTIEYNSLSWVKAQLDDVLTDAQSNLSDYIESNTDEDLENCIEHLQLIYGTLQMVEVYGASMLAEEMRYTATALLEGKVESTFDAYDVLMRAMLQLPDYLEGVQAGKMDAPITLMPLINDLRVVRKECLLTEGVLFSPDIENTVIPSDEYAADSIEPGKLQSEVKRLRTHFQIGLLDYIKNNKERMGLQRMKAVLNSLEKVTSHSEVRNIWMIVSALIDGLKSRGIEKSVSVQTLLSGVDRQLKLVLNVGEDEFLNHYSKDLVKNALYYVGLCTTESDSLSAVKQVYKLDDLMPHEANESAAASGGLNADLFDTVSKGMSEDLAQVKDVLELFMHSSEKELERLVPVAEKLGKIGDTYGMLGMGATRQSILEQKNVLENIINGEVEASEPVVLEMASSLLNAEAELKDYIADRSGFVDMNKEKDVKSVPASEYRQVIFTVVAEAMKNFGNAKEAILSYVSGDGDKDQLKEQLNVVLDSLEEVRGVAMMLPLRRVCSQIEKLQSYIRVVLLNNKHEVTESEQDTVADVVTSIEYYFEALSEGRPGVEQGLNSGDGAAEKLGEITQSYISELDDAPVDSDSQIEAEAEKETTAENVVAFDEISVDTVVDEQSAVDTEESAEAEDVAQDSAEQQSVKFAILADDADEEIVEIFIEEAVEVLGELHEHLPQWQADADNEEALAVIRRGFHTLKGSGRLLGAEMIGEFSWKFENMLNCFIDNKITVSDSMHQALDEAIAVLPQLIEQLKGNREPIENIESLMSAADAISDGRNVAAEQAELVEETVETDTLDIDEGQAETSDLEVVSEDSAGDISASDVVEVIKFDNVVIGDHSDFDINELDADNNFSLEEIQVESVGSEEEIIESDMELMLDTDAVDSTGDNSEVSVENLADSDVIEELVSLDVDDTLEDDFEIDLDVVSETDADSDTNVVDIVAGNEVASESFEDNDVVEELVSLDTADVVIDDLEIDLNDETTVINNELSDEDAVEIGSASDVVDISVENENEDEYDEIANVLGGLAGSELDEEQVSLDTADIVEDDIELVSLDATELVEDDYEVISEADAESKELSEEDINVEAIVVSKDEDEDDDVEVILADESSDFAMSDDELQIDPMLLTIYHDESISHLNDIGLKLDECDAGQHQLQADKVLLRAFHTLYGSARTAEVASIADLAGATEKYVKARQDSGDENIPDDIALVIREVEQSVANMLGRVVEGKIPASNDLLHEKLNKIVQQEIQSQLQNSLEEVAGDEVVDEQRSVVEDPAFEDDDLDVIKIVELDEAEEEREEPEAEDGEQQLESAEISYGDIDDELLDIFLEEADELIEDCELTLTEIKQQPNSTEHIQQLQRNMHTLKGGARMADISPVGDLTHSLESLVVMVSENKMSVDDAWLGLLQESLDALTALLSSVKKRHPLDSVEDLNNRIESLMSGDVHEKRHVERFDIELDDLESVDDEDLESIEASELVAESQGVVENKSDDKDTGKKDFEDKEQQLAVSDEKKPLWGERASDVNYKDTQEQVRVRADLLNDLVDYAGEVNIYHARMGKQVTDFGFNLSELTQTVVRLKDQLRNLEIETEIQIRSGYEKESDSFDDNFDPLEMDQYSTLQQLTRSLSETAGDVESLNKILADIMRDSETLLVQESRISSELQEGLMRTRMVRFGGLSSRLRRIVRQVARELDKEVEVEIDGENSEVDRTVLDRIIAPLEHMLRNAVAHGIEVPEARRVLGKNEKGRISIKVVCCNLYYIPVLVPQMK